MLCLGFFGILKIGKKKTRILYVVKFEMHIFDVNHMISSELCDREKECVREELSHLYYIYHTRVKNKAVLQSCLH
jgi:hypothetical protein